MRADVASRVSVNHCVRDDEIERVEAMLSAADAGEWRVVDGRVQRYGGKPLEKPGSLALMAESVSIIPRLVRGLRALEEALANAWAGEASWKAQCVRERADHAAAMGRANARQTAPEHEINTLVAAIEAGAVNARAVPGMLRAWAMGESMGEGSYRLTLNDLAAAQKRASEEKAFRVERDTETQRGRAEVSALLAELKLTKREREAIAGRVKVQASLFAVEDK